MQPSTIDLKPEPVHGSTTGSAGLDAGRPGRGRERERLGTDVHALGRGVLAKVYGLLAFSLVISLAGGFVGSHLAPGLLIFAFPVLIVLVLGVRALREHEPWHVLLLYTV